MFTFLYIFTFSSYIKYTYFCMWVKTRVTWLQTNGQRCYWLLENRQTNFKFYWLLKNGQYLLITDKLLTNNNISDQDKILTTANQKTPCSRCCILFKWNFKQLFVDAYCQILYTEHNCLIKLINSKHTLLQHISFS